MGFFDVVATSVCVAVSFRILVIELFGLSQTVHGVWAEFGLGGLPRGSFLLQLPFQFKHVLKSGSLRALGIGLRLGVLYIPAGENALSF